MVLEHESYELGVAGSSPARSNIFFMIRANRLVVNATSLKPTSFGFAGSNPASCKIFILITTFGLLLIYIPTCNPIMYSNQAYFHINPPPVLVLSFKCTEIDDFGTDVFLDASLILIYSYNKLLSISYCLIFVPNLLSI